MSWGKSAGKSFVKGKGKGKGKKEPLVNADGLRGHELPRTRISAEKFTGTVLRWKGKYGWIQAAEQIEHEKASLREGKLFAGIDDIVGGTSLDEGAEVEFHIFEDESGLGVEEIVQTGEGKPLKGGKAAGGKGKALGAKGKTMSPTWGGGKATGKGWNTMSVLSSIMSLKGKGFGKGKVIKGLAKGKGKGKKDGHLLPRTRISAEKFSGTVTAWKGKYGWIQPAEPIEHEKAGKRNGALFVSLNDLEGGLTELTAEAVVEFHIAEDASGLCAEEVAQL